MKYLFSMNLFLPTLIAAVCTMNLPQLLSFIFSTVRSAHENYLYYLHFMYLASRVLATFLPHFCLFSFPLALVHIFTPYVCFTFDLVVSFLSPFYSLFRLSLSVYFYS